MKSLSKYNIQVQLVLFITIVFVTCGIVGVFSVYQKISKDRNQEQISAVKEALLNFERLNLDNFETYDYHEVFRNLNQYQFPSQVAYVAITDKAGNIVTERWMALFSDDPVLLKAMHEKMLISHRMGVGADEIVSSNGYLYFIMPVVSGEDTILARLHLFLDFSQIKQQSFRYGIMLIGLLVLCLALILATVIFASRRVMKPIAKFHNYLQGSRGNVASLFEGYHDFPVDIRNLVIQYNTLISDLKRSEDVLRCQAVDAAIGKTASQVAHDIRSPLSSLKAAGDLLRTIVGGNEDGREALNLLQLSGNRLSDIANGLLAKHKGDELVAQVFSIHEVLDELIGELQASPLGVGTEFKKQYHSGALYITGDKTAINRAIGNIIKNALEAMQGNPADRAKQLIVSTSVTAPSPQPSPTWGEGIMIRITDTGPGIPADKIPLILQGGHTEGKADGHGIGTKVVSEVIAAHQGHLNIESEVGVGTTFSITLPATLHHEDMTVTIPHVSGGNIIVIDDEPSLREQWRLTLKARGVVPEIYSCWEEYGACHREEAEGRRGDPGCADTFIIDYHFDNSLVDGLEIIRRLQSKGHTQFILATAEYWKPDLKEAAQKLRVTLCPKPLPKIVVTRGVIANPDGVKQSSEANGIATQPAAARNDKSGPTVLLIDDDPTMHIAWRLQCKTWGVQGFHAFLSMEDCSQSDINYTAIDVAFIDKNINGSTWALDKTITHLKSNGVQKVWIASGESTKELQADPFCAAADGVVKGKMPENLVGYL